MSNPKPERAGQGLRTFYQRLSAVGSQSVFDPTVTAASQILGSGFLLFTQAKAFEYLVPGQKPGKENMNRELDKTISPSKRRNGSQSLPRQQKGINLRAAYKALIGAYERTHVSSLTGIVPKSAPKYKGEQDDKNKI